MPITPETLRTQVRVALDEARARLETLLALPTDAPLATVVLAFDRIDQALDESMEQVGVLTAVHPDEPVRNTAEALEQELVAFVTELSLNRRVYDRLSALAPPGDAPSGDALDRRLLERALRDYRRSGVDRDEPTRERIRALQDELVEIGQTFDRNIVEGGRRLRIEEGHAGLAGLPADYLAARPEEADGSLTLTTDPPDYLPFMLYAERGDLRHKLFFEFLNRAHPQNLEVLDRLLAKRHELARLLGYGSWAQYITEDKMVRDPETVRGFIERVTELAGPRAREIYDELLAEKRRTQPEAEVVHDWEKFYLVECIKRRSFDFDSQAVRPYFAYERVQRGVLDTIERLYGVELRRTTEPEVWHESVESYEVVDGGRLIARFHLDMFPREGKYKHAAQFSLRHGIEGRVLPEAVLVCNFPRPVDGDPALLMHSEVTTLFHEFGHLLHHLFAGGHRFRRFSGIETEWDFVEVPSQMFEEWAWDVDVLQTFALHHQTGEPIPAELVDKLRAAQEYDKALSVATQMLYARYSLACYQGDPAGLDTTALLRELRESMTPFAHVPGTHFQAAFGHLNGYSAIYYTYMWSLVISKDLVGAFDGGLMDRGTAATYRARVLAPGGTRDAADLVRDFLGRDYGFEAWEAWLRR